MKVEIHEDRCIGAGQCVAVAGGVFTQRDSDGIVELLRADVPAGGEEDVKEAELVCPAGAISIAD
ncbi:ferredoxin [Actinokineospora sp. G85]|uniref:ferredoxin n=1 Tax=Actinokineospora TaxID=39845 RepID=UPI0012EADB94|nr:ferredoxin [Actinokineospora pegani]